MRLKPIIVSITLLISAFVFAQEKTPAFPGAEGFGRYVSGGRGGKVFHVTNLNDSGNGSLRWALSQSGAKTIVFDVSGTIHLSSSLSIGSNTTIAGQTAPGDGICIADYPCSINGNNVIVRYMRFRLGNKNVKVNGADGWDGFGGFDQKDWMIDHCSVSWSIDECLSVLGNKNTTVQWCLVAQSLVNAGHSKGAHGYGGNWGGSGASFHHNLLVHHGSRTPRLGPRPTTQLDERMDMRNNVIYNYGGNGCYGGEGMHVNIVNNYYKPGPTTLARKENYQKRIAGLGIRTQSYVESYPAYAPALHLWGKYYVNGNVNSKWSDVTNDNWTFGIYNQITASDNDGLYNETVKDTIKLNQPIQFIYTTTHSAEKAYEKVLAYAGASLHRDSFDELMIADTRNGVATYTGTGLAKGMVNSQDDNKPANADSDWDAWPVLNSATALKDTDGDGMPDDWEKANGLNPNDSSDGNITDSDGYTNLEKYLNGIVSEITTNGNKDGEVLGEIEEVEKPEDTNEPGMITTGSGAVVWPFGEGTEGQTAEYSGNISPMISSNSITIGTNLTYKERRTFNNIRFTSIQPLIDNEASSNDGNAISFNINMNDGYYFRPKNISFLAARIGTDGGLLDVSWKNDKGKWLIDEAIKPERNNNYTTFSKDINNISSSEGTNSLSFNIYKLGSSKQIAIANVSISGEVKKVDNGISSVSDCNFSSKYYSIQGMKLSNLQKGINIQVLTNSNGTKETRKIIY